MLLLEFATTSEICQQLGKEINRVRLDKALPQAELADRAGVSVGTVKNLETHGKATLESLVKVLKVLGLVETLFSAFTPPVPSIAALQKAEAPARKRAPRRTRSISSKTSGNKD